MKKINHRHLLGLLVTLILCQFIPQTVFCQTEKLGIVGYTPPKDWSKTAKENIVSFTEYNQSTGVFCIITLYGATPGTGSPEKDFKREWKNLVVEPFKAEPNPETETEAEDGWTAMAGGAAIEFQGTKAAAFLTVISGGGKTISILSVFNNQSYAAQIAAFTSKIELGKAVAEIPQTTPQLQDGKLVIPMPTRQLTVADLAGEWGETAGFTTRYVDRYSGTYAGFESLHFRSKMTITKDGGYADDFFAINNGKKIIENTTGTITIVGRVLTIRQKNTAKYVIRGWLELTDMTVLTVCGPWYNDDVIPEAIFTNPGQGANLDKNWIRKK